MGEGPRVSYWGRSQYNVTNQAFEILLEFCHINFPSLSLSCQTSDQLLCSHQLNCRYLLLLLQWLWFSQCVFVISLKRCDFVLNLLQGFLLNGQLTFDNLEGFFCAFELDLFGFDFLFNSKQGFDCTDPNTQTFGGCWDTGDFLRYEVLIAKIAFFEFFYLLIGHGAGFELTQYF